MPAASAARLRTACAADAAAICDVYNPYVLDTCFSFEEEPVTPAQMCRRMQAHGEHYPWLVIEAAGTIEAFAHAVPWKARAAYRHSVESSIYVAPEAQRCGRGRWLYGALLERLRDAGMHTAIAGIALPNAPSVALHEALGFTRVAHFRQVGRKHGRWIDVGYWQLQL